MDHGASSYRRYLDGDETAFDQLVTEYYESLVSFLTGYVRERAVAEDIAMDAFADLIVHRHRYDFRVSFKTYLCMLGRSRALNYLKRSKILAFSPLEDAMEVADPSLVPEELLLTKERSRVLAEALEVLRPDQREVIQLVYWQGLSCEDAAKVMRKSRKQVYNLLFRGKNALRTVLEKKGETECMI